MKELHPSYLDSNMVESCNGGRAYYGCGLGYGYGVGNSDGSGSGASMYFNYGVCVNVTGAGVGNGVGYGFGSVILLHMLTMSISMLSSQREDRVIYPIETTVFDAHS